MKNKPGSRFILSLPLLLLSLAVKAQQPSVWVEAGAGFTFTGTSDSLLSPAHVNGNGVQFFARLIKEGRKRITVLQGDYNTVNYKDDHIRQHSFSLRLMDGYNVLRRKGGPFSLYEGYLVATQAGYSPGNTSSAASWNSYNVIGWYQSLRYIHNRNEVTMDVQVPLAGVVYRTPEVSHTGSKDAGHIINSVYSHPSFASLHNNQVVDVSLQYTRQLSGRIALSAGYQLMYQHWDGENPLTQTRHSLSASLKYNLR